MAVASHPVLDTFITQFAATLKAERTSRFAQIDLAAQILLHFGYAGLHQVGDAVGMDPRVLVVYANIGQAFPPAVRRQWPTLLYSHYREAVRVAKRFSHGASADPQWWARQAYLSGWNTAELRRQGWYHVPLSVDHPPLAEDVVRRAVRMAMAGQKQERRIEMLLARYNAQYAPVTGVVLALCRSPYTPPLSAHS